MTSSPMRQSGDGSSRLPSMQRIGRGSISNLTEFGRSLKRHAIEELSWFIDEVDHGFLDGGCHMFAQALVDWSGGDLRLSAMVRIGQVGIEHYAATDGFIHLDGDGAATVDDMVRKLEVTEGCPGCEVRLDLTGLHHDRIPYSERLVRRLHRGLTVRFGPWPGLSMMADMRMTRSGMKTCRL